MLGLGLDVPVHDTLNALSEAEPGSRFGPYRVVNLLGEGGMGMVYLAEQEEPIQRRVAVKVIKFGMNTREVMARFDAERQSLAMMNHPGIAQVFEAGVTAEGRPYFAMEYVEGQPLTEYCDRRQLTIRERLELFIQVCQAVQHAHQKGVIHRDLKPSNVLVMERDGEPVPKIIDFGLAAAFGTGVSLSGGITRQGSLLGTPEYMSPEQAAGQSADTRSDIYSLGSIFYELLTGASPIDLEPLREGPPDELLRAIRNKRSPSPRRRLASTGVDIEAVSQSRRLSTAKLRALLRGELHWIASKALEKDPARRYETVFEFAADVHNYLIGEPVNAGPASAVYRLRKFVMRHRVGVAATLMLALSITGSAILASVLFVRAESARALALRNQYIAALGAAAFNLAAGDPDEARRHLLACDPDLRGWEWRHLMYRTDPSLGVWKAGGSFPAGFFPSNFGVRDGRLVWHTLTTIEEWSLHGEEHLSRGGIGEVLAINERGTRAACRSADGQIVIYLLGQIQQIAQLTPKRRPVSAAFDPLDRRLAAGTEDGRLLVWDLTYHRLILEIQAHKSAVSSVLWFPDGRRIATAGPDRRVLLWNSASGRLISVVDESASEHWRLAFNPNTKWLAFPARDSSIPGHDVRVKLYGLSKPFVDRSYPSPGDVAAVAFNPVISNGRQYGFVNSSGELQICDEAIGCLTTKRQTHDRLNSLVFAPDGTVAYTGSESGEVTAWDASTRGGSLLPAPANQSAIAMDRNGTILIAAEDGESVGVWSALDGSEVSRWEPRAKSRISAVAFSPDGVHAASATLQGVVRLWHTSGHILQTLTIHDGPVTALQFSPNGALLAAATAGGTVRLWNVMTGSETGELRCGAGVNAIAFHPNGLLLVTGLRRQAAPVQVWDLGRMTVARTFALAGEVVSSLLVSPGGKTLFAGSEPSGKIGVWDLRTARRLALLAGHSASVRALAYHPDGSRLVAGSDDGILRIWETGSWEELLTLRGHSDPVRFVAFASNGSRLISAGSGVRLWTTREGARWPSRTPGKL